jgi:hypothetical protein
VDLGGGIVGSKQVQRVSREVTERSREKKKPSRLKRGRVAHRTSPIRLLQGEDKEFDLIEEKLSSPSHGARMCKKTPVSG